MSAVSRGFGGDAPSVGAARAFAAAAIAQLGVDDLEWVLLQVVSELATNVVVHAHTPFTLSLTVSGDSVRLEVHDSSPKRVQARHYGADATTGRGLLLVEHLSRAWGVDPYPDGKTIWVELDQQQGEADADALLDMFADHEELVGQ